jgi:lincosamide nucleotidyltransferase A/C/D/E
MAEHVMSARSVTSLLGALTSAGVDACVGGGWAVDALLGEQTRPHADLDLWIPANEFDGLVVAVAHSGVDRVFPWGGDRPWNFVLHDGEHRRLDLHLYETLDDGSIHYGGVSDGETFPAEALRGSGRIDGRAVRCEAAQWSLAWHTGYDPRPVDLHDVRLLFARFGLAPPKELR